MAKAFLPVEYSSEGIFSSERWVRVVDSRGNSLMELFEECHFRRGSETGIDNSNLLSKKPSRLTTH
ncbi:MAG: hypothetical protein AABX30_00375 [Nanoarchaeota archaeon]